MNEWIPNRHSFLCLGISCIGEATTDKAIHCIVTADFHKLLHTVPVSLGYSCFPLKLPRIVYCLSFHMFPRMMILAFSKCAIGRCLTHHRSRFDHTSYSWSSFSMCVIVALFPSPSGEYSTYHSISDQINQ